MITEDYVSFETAKLLKEKGFNAECHSHYYPCHYPDGTIEYRKYKKTAIKKNKSWYDIYTLENLPKDHYLAPTLQMAMKWLREEKLRFITMDVDYLTDSPRYGWHIEDLSIMDDNMEYVEDRYQTYEEACEAAIKYCLENLI